MTKSVLRVKCFFGKLMLRLVGLLKITNGQMR